MLIKQSMYISRFVTLIQIESVKLLILLWIPMILLVDSEGPDQTARMRRLILTFVVRICPKTCFRMARGPNKCNTLKTWKSMCPVVKEQYAKSLSSTQRHVPADAAITKTCHYNFDPLKPHFYSVKLGFTGVNIIFLISAQKHRLWVLVRNASSRRF